MITGCLFYGYTVRGAIFRKAAKGSFVNNTTQGATSTYMPPEEIDAGVALMAKQAAKAVGNAIAGVVLCPGLTVNFICLR